MRRDELASKQPAAENEGLPSQNGGTYNEAKSEPRVRLSYRPRKVSAIVASADQPFIAFNLLAEGVLATSENDAHRYSGSR